MIGTSLTMVKFPKQFSETEFGHGASFEQAHKPEDTFMLSVPTGIYRKDNLLRLLGQ
jgi:hypothetical protein